MALASTSESEVRRALFTLGSIPGQQSTTATVRSLGHQLEFGSTVDEHVSRIIAVEDTRAATFITPVRKRRVRPVATQISSNPVLTVGIGLLNYLVLSLSRARAHKPSHSFLNESLTHRLGQPIASLVLIAGHRSCVRSSRSPDY